MAAPEWVPHVYRLPRPNPRASFACKPLARGHRARRQSRRNAGAVEALCPLAAAHSGCNGARSCTEASRKLQAHHALSGIRMDGARSLEEAGGGRGEARGGGELSRGRSAKGARRLSTSDRFRRGQTGLHTRLRFGTEPREPAARGGPSDPSGGAPSAKLYDCGLASTRGTPCAVGLGACQRPPALSSGAAAPTGALDPRVAMRHAHSIHAGRRRATKDIPCADCATAWADSGANACADGICAGAGAAIGKGGRAVAAGAPAHRHLSVLSARSSGGFAPACTAACICRNCSSLRSIRWHVSL